MGLKSLCADLHINVTINLLTDSNAARGICNRRGVGKVRHIDVQYLWLQEKVQARQLDLQKVLGSENPADILTKYVEARIIGEMLDRMAMTRAT